MATQPISREDKKQPLELPYCSDPNCQSCQELREMQEAIVGPAKYLQNEFGSAVKKDRSRGRGQLGSSWFLALVFRHLPPVPSWVRRPVQAIRPKLGKLSHGWPDVIFVVMIAFSVLGLILRFIRR